MNLPFGWSVLTLDEVCSGRLQTGPFGSQLHADEYTDEGIPVVMPKDIVAGRIVVATAARIPESRAAQLKRHRIQVGDVLFSRRGDVARAGLATKNDEGFLCGTGCLRARPDRSKARPEFLNLLIQSPTAKRWLENNAVGQTMPNMNTEILSQLTFRVPPLSEQQQISELVSSWDVAIEKIEWLIAAKERHFSAELGRLITRHTSAASWQQVPIRQFAERIQRQCDGGNYPLLTIASASGFVLQEKKYGRYMAGESAKTYTLLRVGEFSYNKGNSLRFEFGCVIQLQEYEAALVPSVYVSFSLHETVCAAYLRHLFSADYLKPQLRSLVKTGVRNNGLLNIRPDEFMGTTVPLPPIQDQKRIADVLDAARLEITLLLKKVEALKQQKRGLMQKLLTGQWRVPLKSKKATK